MRYINPRFIYLHAYLLTCAVVTDTHRSCAWREYYPENGCRSYGDDVTYCFCDTELCNSDVTMVSLSPGLRDVPEY